MSWWDDMMSSIGMADNSAPSPPPDATPRPQAPDRIADPGTTYTNVQQPGLLSRALDFKIDPFGVYRPSVRDAINFAGELSPGASVRDFVQGGGQLTRGLLHGDLSGAGGGLAGMGMAALGLVPGERLLAKGVKGLSETERAAVAAERKLPVDATLGTKTPDVTFKGKQPGEWSPQDWGDFGRQYGVPNLGPADEEAWRSNLGKLKTQSGREVTVPGGINSKEPFSYYDLLHMKSQGIDPNDLTPKQHQSIHDRMVGAMQPGPGGPTNTQIANQYLFGLISPNQPLTANELALQRVGIKGPQDLENLANMARSYTEGGTPKEQRNTVSNLITSVLGVQGEPKGGLGVSGSQDYTALSEFAQKMRDRPDFFRFNRDDPAFAGMSDSQAWTAHVERVLNEVRGLKAKTGSLGSVWQNPQEAAISAIDRHMANKFRGEMFPDAESRMKWENDTLSSFNEGRAADQHATSIDDMRSKPGGVGHFTDKALAYVNALPTAVTRTRTGEFNPSVPGHLQSADWVGGEPKKMQLVQGAYPRALEANQAEATKAGQGLFSNQWMLWDRIRGRLEPHEILFPGLERLPRMSLDQMKLVDKDLSEAGYKAATGKVRPLPSASRAGYFAAPPLIGAGALGGAAAVNGGLLGQDDQSSY